MSGWLLKRNLLRCMVTRM